MQFSESWLRTFVNPSLSSEELSYLLTMAGLEVEKIEVVAPPFDKVVVAQVLTKKKHPNADRLNLLTVDAGQGESLSIVCGAGNVTVGMKAPCALIDAKLPGIEIKRAKVRGVESFGMMCSDIELGLAETSDGLLELPVDAPVGQSIRDYLDLDDKLFTLKLTPNRSDCLSLNGIAREVAALTGAELKLLPQPSFTQASDRSLAIKVDAVAACPRYTGRVITGVNAKAVTPAWMVRRLERSGLRSISALVDVTNYVLLEMGQPLHAFDLNKLNGGIEVRFARSGEKLRLLNEQEVELQPDLLVIADGNGPLALAGIMGGLDSAVDDATTDIFLESAFFTPSAIIGKSRLLGFGSDSSYRFERGVDFAATFSALDRATQLIIDICGGQAGSVVEVCGELPARNPVRLRISRLCRVLGIALGTEEISRILSLLGMHFSHENGEFKATPPSYRFDIAIEEDLIEEVARVYGYERIPAAVPQSTVRMLEQPESQRPVAKLRQEMALRDYQETINYSFVMAEWERDLCGNAQPIALQNPIASQMGVMRSSLLGGLVGALQYNLARKHSRVRLFEIGGCFATGADSYVQHEHLAGVCYGQALPEQWGMPARNVDFYDVKGDVEALFAPAVLKFTAASHPASHPGRSAQIILDDQAIGWIGELHPQWQQKFDLAQPLIWFEVSLDTLAQTSMPQVIEISRFPSVRRDLAIIVDEATTVQSLLDTMLAGHVPYVAEIDLFDLYRGKGVESGKKSLAFRVLLQDTQKTLTEADIDQSMALLIEKLRELGAQLRV
jgi:phenylalanyl-tRNA synthetase beta chain